MPLAMLGSKRDFRALMRVSSDRLVIPWHLYRDNILRNTPQVGLLDWQNIGIHIIGGLDMRIASCSFGLDRVQALNSDYGFTGLEHQFCPDLSHLLLKVNSFRVPLLSNISRHKETFSNRISGILSHCGEIFTCNYGIDLPKLLQTDFVLELDGLAQEMKELLIVLLCARIFMYRIAQGQRTHHLRTLIVIDDAQQIFRRVYELKDAPFFMADLIAQAREFGTGMVVAVQNTRDLAFCLTGNTALKIAFKFSDNRDLEELARII